MKIEECHLIFFQTGLKGFTGYFQFPVSGGGSYPENSADPVKNVV